MRISLSATNPCHLFPLALELARAEALAHYYSGYPGWKLSPPRAVARHVRTHSVRTTLVYGALKFLPPNLRPAPRAMFLWQDHGFDTWVGSHLRPCDAIHAMPGQALRTFQGARKFGIPTVLNHATGPVRDWVRVMEPEYQRVGLKLTDVCPYDDAYFAREDEEYALADFHCAASTVVRDQLLAHGIPAGRIWLSPYAADPAIFHPRDRITPTGGLRLVFAGQIGLRKDIRTLLSALQTLDRPNWELHFYGAVAPEAHQDLGAYDGRTTLIQHGPVSQRDLAAAFRQASLLILPSLEEGFGLVIPQALNCGLPCIVSDRVGGRDLIRHRDNGSIFPVRSAATLAEELAWWERNWHPAQDTLTWAAPAQSLITQTAASLSAFKS